MAAPARSGLKASGSNDKAVSGTSPRPRDDAPRQNRGGDVHGGLGQLRADDEELLVQVTRCDQGQGVDERVTGANHKVGP